MKKMKKMGVLKIMCIPIYPLFIFLGQRLALFVATVGHCLAFLQLNDGLDDKKLRKV